MFYRHVVFCDNIDLVFEIILFQLSKNMDDFQLFNY